MRRPSVLHLLLAAAIVTIPSLLRADPPITLLTLKSNMPAGLAFSADGKTLAVSDVKGSVTIVSFSDGRILHTLKAHEQHVYGVAFAPDGKLLATGSHDGRIKLWDPATGALKATWGAEGDSRVLQFTPDGKRLLSWSNKGPITLWDVATRAPVFQITNVPRIFAARLDGKEFSTVDLDQGIQFWDGVTGRELPRREGFPGIGRMAYSPTVDQIAFAQRDGFVRIKEAATGKDLVKMVTPVKDVLKLVYSADGKQLGCNYGVGEDGVAIVWDAATGKEVYKVRGGSASFVELAFSRDGKYLVTTHHTSINSSLSVMLWDLKSPPPTEPVAKPPPSLQPEVAVTPPPVPPATDEPPEAPMKPPAKGNPPTQPAAPATPAVPAAKPAAGATMQTVAGKWKLNKTLTTTLLPDGTLKTNYPAIRGGTWTLTNGDTVTISTAKGVAVYTFKLDTTGMAGTGNWKDGSKAAPTKMQ